MRIITSIIGFLAIASVFAGSPAESLTKLKEGNARFVAGANKYSGVDQARRTETTTNGQHPYVTILSCSDSRVPLEYIFDAGIGELFVIRVAGNVVDTDEAGSIEYGIGHLHTPLLVVLGHSHCGAVTAVAKGAEVHGNIPKLVDNIAPAVQRAKASHGTEVNDVLINKAIEENVWQSIEDLLSISAETIELIHEGKLQVVGAIYDLEKGSIQWLGEHPQQSKLMEKKESTHSNH